MFMFCVGFLSTVSLLDIRQLPCHDVIVCPHDPQEDRHLVFERSQPDPDHPILHR